MTLFENRGDCRCCGYESRSNWTIKQAKLLNCQTRQLTVSYPVKLLSLSGRNIHRENGHVKTELEIRVMLPWGKEHLVTPEGHFDFQTCSIQKCEKIDLCWFKPLCLWWFVMASPRKSACEIRLVFNQLEFRSRAHAAWEDMWGGLTLWVKYAFWSSEVIMTGTV